MNYKPWPIRTNLIVSAHTHAVSSFACFGVSWYFAVDVLEYPVHVIPMVVFTVVGLLNAAVCVECAARAWRAK